MENFENMDIGDKLHDYPYGRSFTIKRSILNMAEIYVEKRGRKFSLNKACEEGFILWIENEKKRGAKTEEAKNGITLSA
jgi:hypothetical protein